jgi:hypothetical protein
MAFQLHFALPAGVCAGNAFYSRRPSELECDASSHRFRHWSIRACFVTHSFALRHSEFTSQLGNWKSRSLRDSAGWQPASRVRPAAELPDALSQSGWAIDEFPWKAKAFG